MEDADGIGGRALKITTNEKVLFEAANFWKDELLADDLSEEVQGPTGFFVW